MNSVFFVIAAVTTAKDITMTLGEKLLFTFLETKDKYRPGRQPSIEGCP